MHFVWKEDQTLRGVGDYRGVNQMTVLDIHPLPHVRDYIHDIAGCKIFSKVDLKKAFHHLLIDERDRHYTCVTTPWGMYNFRRLSMGMANSAQSFQKLVESVLAGLDNTFAYLDDILVYSKTKEEHLKTLEELFQRLAKAGLAISLKKCKFGVTEVNYLGYRVSEAGLAPMERKIEGLMKFPAPTKQKELLAFLGALNYYRASLPKLSPEESVNKSIKESRTPAAVLDPFYKLVTCKLKKSAVDFKKIWSENNIIEPLKEDIRQSRTCQRLH